MPSLQAGAPLFPLDALQGRRFNQLAESAGEVGSPVAATALSAALIGQTRAFLISLLTASDMQTLRLADESMVKAYFDRPRVILISAKLAAMGNQSGDLSFATDLRRDTIRGIVFPGQDVSAGESFQGVRGILESFVEGSIFPEPASVGGLSLRRRIDTPAVFAAAADQGIPLVGLAPGDSGLLDTLQISDEARARISVALQAGKGVSVPARSVMIEGTPAVAWYEFNPTSGELIGVGEDGGHSALALYAGVGAIMIAGLLLLEYPLGELAAQETFAILGIAYRTELAALSKHRSGYAFSAAKRNLRRRIGRDVAAAIKLVEESLNNPLFKAGFTNAIREDLRIFLSSLPSDPPVPSPPVALQGPEIDLSFNAEGVTPPVLAAPGAVSGTGDLSSLRVANHLDASWSSGSASAFLVDSLTAAGATVRDASGATVGVGTVVLAAPGAGPAPLAISGDVQYGVSGEGNLAFYGSAATGLGVSGDWGSYAAIVSGSVTLSVSTGVLTLNGSPLPVGSYSITAPSATFNGSGRSSSPSFSGAVTIAARDATLTLGQGTGTFNLSGGIADLGNGLTLAGYTGTINVTAGGGDTDAVTLDGTAAHALSLSGTPAGLTTDQNTPVTIQAQVRTSFADTYEVSAQAPPGWTVVVDANGLVTLTPAPGVQGGSYPIQLVARSMTRPDLVAQAIVNVTITPTLPGIALDVAPDPIYFVPFNGAPLPTAFRATLHNPGPAADTFALTFAGVPAGFQVLAGNSTLTIPAGQTAVVGIYLQATGQVPPIGTQLSFTVTATSASDPTITASGTASTVVPAVHGATLTGPPPALNTTPGVAVTTTITITNVGNVPESISLSPTAAAGLAVTGLSPVSLQPGESTTLVVTLTPAVTTPLNTRLDLTLTAVFGGAVVELPPTLFLPVNVAVPGATAIADAAVAAGQLGNGDLANRLGDLGMALTTLVQTPTSTAARGQALASLDAIVGLLATDPFLAPMIPALTAGRAALTQAATPVEIQAAVSSLGDALDDLGTTLTDAAAHRFTIELVNNSEVGRPQVPTTYQLIVQNTGTQTTTYDLSLAGLPAGVTGVLSQDSITLAPGEFSTGGAGLAVTVTSTSATELEPFSFTITAAAATAPAIRRSVTAAFTVPAALVQVVAVRTDPPFSDPGGQVGVTARILNAVNRQQEAAVSYAVIDAGGNTLFTSSPVTVSLNVLTTLTDVDLGNLDTTGFAPGNVTIRVTVADASGTPIAGASGQGTLLIGTPVTATLVSAPTGLPAGGGSVMTTLQIDSQVALANPLGIEGQATVTGTGDDAIRLGDFLYFAGPAGIGVFNVAGANLSNPQLVRTVGRPAISLRIRGDRLVALETRGGPAVNTIRTAVSIYSLADPADPQLLGSTPDLPYSFATDIVVTDTHVFVVTIIIPFITSNRDIFGQHGALLAINITDPTTPFLDGDAVTASGTPAGRDGVNDGVLFNDNGTNTDGVGAVAGVDASGGNRALFSVAQLDATTLLVTGGTPTGSDTQTGVGLVYVVDISDPRNMVVVRQRQLPGTVQAIGIAIEGDRALVTASVTGFADLGDHNVTGIVLVTLDVSRPRDPDGLLILASQTSNLTLRGVGRAASLGNGLFTFAVNGPVAPTDPRLFLVEAGDPTKLSASGISVPTTITRLSGGGDLIYTASPSGLIIYRVEGPPGIPVTARVQVPKNNGVSVVPGSFNAPPTRMIDGVNAVTLEWDLTFTVDSTSQTFTWRSAVAGLQPNEARTVALGGMVEFASQGTPGVLPLPAQVVTGNAIIGLNPVTRTVVPGATASYSVRLLNPSSSPVTYTLSVHGVPAGWVDLASTVTVAANGSIDVPLMLTPDAFAALGDAGFTVSAAGSNGAVDSVVGALVLQGDPTPVDPEAHGVVVGLIPTQAVAGQGTSAFYVVRVANAGSVAETFALSVTGLPAGISAEFGEPIVELAPGASNSRDVSLKLTSSRGTIPGEIAFTVQAAATAQASVTSSAAGALTVVSFGVAIVLNPPTGAPGASFALTVTNTGTVTDTFDLAPAGPAALVASLGQSQVTLAPGASQVVPIGTGAVNFSLPGGLALMATATSRGNPAVRAAARADLGIAPSQGLSARFDPATKTLDTPGFVTFLLNVANTGNAEDLYEATITGTSGPVTATLVGLDGVPTRQVPLLPLPGLSSGVLQLQVNLASLGQGAVTVQVRSLSNAAMTATATATVTTDVVAVRVGTTTRLTASPDPAPAGQAVTLVATVAPVSGSNTPTGTVTFTVDGLAQPPVALQAVAGGARAVLTLTLPAGSHAVSATYSGDAGFAPSTAAPISSRVLESPTPTPPVDVPGVVPVVPSVPGTVNGPTVVSLQRFGIHQQPTRLALTFDRRLDPTGALDVRNYRLRDAQGRPIRIVSVDYDPSGQVVRLHPRRRLGVNHRYTLTVNGNGPGGLADTAGNRLDGDRDGRPGGNYASVVNRGKLVLGPAASRLLPGLRAFRHPR